MDIIHEGQDPQGNGWQTRVVINKFPIVKSASGGKFKEQDLFSSRSSGGFHEVLIESPRHDQNLPEMTPEAFQRITTMYIARYREHARDKRIKTITLFRNHGPRAGTSLQHPHAQLIAIDFLPKEVQERETRAAAYYQEHDSCLLCDLIEQERKDGSRMIKDDKHFLSITPYFAQSPYEIWILPKNHQAHFGKIVGDQLPDFSRMLQDSLQRLHRLLDEPDYNYVIHSATHLQRDRSHLHWYLQIHPRITSRAGFELGTGISVNPHLPENDARALREIKPG